MDLLGYLAARDFQGALTVLRFTQGLGRDAAAQWRAYLLFHAGRHEEALEVYTQLAGGADGSGGSKSFDLHLAACCFRLRRFEEARRHAERVGGAGGWAAGMCGTETAPGTAPSHTCHSKGTDTHLIDPLLGQRRAPTARCERACCCTARPGCRAPPPTSRPSPLRWTAMWTTRCAWDRE